MVIEIFSHEGWSVISLAVSLGALLGHNFWVVAGQRRRDELRLEAHVGHHFPNSESAIAPERIADFRLITQHGETSLDNCNVEGTALVTETVNRAAETTMSVLSLHPRTITLAANSFTKYLQEEDALESVATDFLPDRTTTPQQELYSKYAKAILPRGDDAVACRVIGQTMEIVPERNPARVKPGERLPLRLLLDGEPVAGARISTSCDRWHAGGYLAHVRTDAAGRAEIELPLCGYWFVRSHFIRRHPAATVAQWESFWPSLTFRIDD